MAIDDTVEPRLLGAGFCNPLDGLYAFESDVLQ
jgi:hypothetical protein